MHKANNYLLNIHAQKKCKIFACYVKRGRKIKKKKNSQNNFQTRSNNSPQRKLNERNIPLKKNQLISTQGIANHHTKKGCAIVYVYVRACKFTGGGQHLLENTRPSILTKLQLGLRDRNALFCFYSFCACVLERRAGGGWGRFHPKETSPPRGTSPPLSFSLPSYLYMLDFASV